MEQEIIEVIEKWQFIQQVIFISVLIITSIILLTVVRVKVNAYFKRRSDERINDELEQWIDQQGGAQ